MTRIICLVLGLTLTFVAFNKRPTSAALEQADKPVEQVQKNIQVLTGMPSSQLLPVMHFMRTSLGVRCDYCHVAENGKYWMDDKPAKQTARRMLRMVFEINKANFGGQPVVTCNTCHRGSTKPIPVPAIGQGSFTNTTFADDVSGTPDQFPTAEQVLDKYVQAIGGKAPVDKIKTRWTQITLLRPRLVNSGNSRAVILNRGESWTVESFQKTPNKYLSITTTPDGVIYQGFNGTVGWTKSTRGQREMNAAEVARIKRQADLYNDLNLKDRYSELRLNGKSTIGDKEVYVVEARSLENKTEKLFFDVKSGFLLRRVVFTEIKLGLDPEQTDYEDYRKVDGVWLPFTIRVSYLDDNHYGTTRTVTKVRQNIQIDDAKFEAPR
jgi:photosynthetic reaction center cytochrome c subunit